MKYAVIIYWSGSGNTQQMAVAVAEGARSVDVGVKLLPVSKATVQDVLTADAVALGCPAMGDEALEEEEMEPFVTDLEKEQLAGKPFVLFGSYDWGDGQWMLDWQERMKRKGVRLVDEGLILQNTPDEDGLAECRELGVRLASLVNRQ
ncbi:flavodoxin [Candidatus Formimonas warabiya]|uniref:Flavodoxin n=1 Tax=Formimonas warabiya TaxID=1761012 RepID=A0A3G1KYJ4_FORW1|nr:flavodoxin [Candidatus Formimonas warabiya]ATW27548.1 flavodoxin [Candidatus Formimonas warabiya]